jgi:hypothetical protein
MPTDQTGEELVVFHPRTGELIDPRDAPTETLAEALLLLRDRARDLRRMTGLLDAELRDRMAEQHPGRIWVIGDYELRRRNEAAWDADELEGVVRELLDRGELHQHDVTGIFKHEITISRSAAGRLLDRLHGPAHDAVDACRTWRVRGVEVARCVPLLAPAEHD